MWGWCRCVERGPLVPERTLFFALALTLPAPATAQALPPDEEVVVTGRALPPTPGAAAYGTVEIGRDRLESVASGRLEDALRDVAGFQQFRRSDSRTANPTSQGVTLRALGGNAASRALVLLDGVPQADPFTGFVPFSALALERLARVRVVRGGGAGPFGAGALAGTIELESAGPDTVGPGYARGFVGGRGATELAVGIAPRLGNGFATLGGRWDRGDGFRLVPSGQRGPVDIRAAFESWSVSGRAVAPLGPDLELQAAGLAFDDRRLRGLPGADVGTDGVDGSLRLLARGRWRAEALAYLQTRDLASKFVAVAPGRSAVTPTLDQFATPARGWGGKVEVRPPLGGSHPLRLGADLRGASGTTNERFRFGNGAFTRLRRAGGETGSAGLFAEGDWALGALILTGGVRLDRWWIEDGALAERDIVTGATTQALAFPDRSGVRPSVRGGASWRAGESASLRAAAYTGFRLPTPNELFRSFRVGADAVAANAALRLERLGGMEVGIDLRAGPGVSLGLTAFDNRLENAIANVTLGQGPGVFPQVGFVAAGGAYRERRNLDAIETRGLELTGSLRRGGWRLDAAYALTDARVRGDGPARALNGKRPAQTARHQASATIGWGREGGADVAATLRYLGPQFEDDLNLRRLPDAMTVDGVASVPLGRGFRLIARAENALGARVVSGVSGDGVLEIAGPRTFWLGLSVSR